MTAALTIRGERIQVAMLKIEDVNFPGSFHSLTARRISLESRQGSV
jgi:hypothetical protein